MFILSGAMVSRVVSKVLVFGPGLTLCMLSVRFLPHLGRMVWSHGQKPIHKSNTADLLDLRHKQS